MLGSEWIKMRVSLSRDPAVVFIARRLRMDPRDVVGRLHEVWSWFDQNTVDGDGRGIDAQFIDELAGKRGFAQAMSSTPLAPWLLVDDGGVALPRFSRHNGSSAKRRAMDCDRKQRGREEDEDRKDVRKMSASDADTKRTERGRLADQKEKEKEIQEGPPVCPPLGDAPLELEPGPVEVAPAPRKQRPEDAPVVHAMARHFAESIRRWKPDAAPTTDSADSRRGLAALLGADNRSPDDIRAMLDWLFGGGYRPHDDFDWRRNVLSGGKLRKQWDTLDALRRRPTLVRDVRVGQGQPGDFSEAAAAGGSRVVTL